MAGISTATLTTVTDRAIADHLALRTRRRKYEGDMPAAPTRQDEAGEHVPDEEADRDASHDPRRTDTRVEGLLLRQYLAQAVKGRPRDEETYAWMVAWLDEETTYEAISEETGIPLGTVHSRIDVFKELYFPRYRRWRNRALVFVILAIGVVVAIVVALLRRPRPDDIRPARDFVFPPPSASSAAPVLPAPPPTFDNALPTQPPGPLKP